MFTCTLITPLFTLITQSFYISYLYKHTPQFQCTLTSVHALSLSPLTDESSLLNGQQPDLPEHYKRRLKDLWEAEFLPVAQALLSRIESHHTDLVPLEPLAPPSP